MTGDSSIDRSNVEILQAILFTFCQLEVILEIRCLHRGIVMEIANKSECKPASLDMGYLYKEQRRLLGVLYHKSQLHSSSHILTIR